MNKLLLLILDGWGINPDPKNNAIDEANPPFWNSLLKDYPNMTLHCREESVGLSKGFLSNSEVGHTAIGAGRIVPQTGYAIDKAIEKNEFEKNKVLLDIESHIEKNDSTLHLIGLLSDGGVHSHIKHLVALVEWAKKKNFPQVALHLFLDGRDMAPMSADRLLEKLEEHLDENIYIATICGRAIGMDRAEQWQRTVEAYKNITGQTPPPVRGRLGGGLEHDQNPQTTLQYIQQNYAENIGDEFIGPASFTETKIEDNDALLFFNFRADRMRQLVKLFLKQAPGAVQDDVEVPNNLFLASMTNYDEDFKIVEVMFPKNIPQNNLGEWISKKGLKQLRLAETEKAAHVTYFINGGQDIQYEGEERLIVPSLGLKDYSGNPEMSLPEITKTLLRALEQKHFDLIICNIANGDMVGHSGNLAAGAKAVMAVDETLKQIVPQAEKCGYKTILTADHGNIEYMEHENAPHTAHTNFDVPLVIFDKAVKLPESGYLNQIAPTVLKLMEIDQPDEMDKDPLV